MRDRLDRLNAQYSDCLRAQGVAGKIKEIEMWECEVTNIVHNELCSWKC